MSDAKYSEVAPLEESHDAEVVRTTTTRSCLGAGIKLLLLLGGLALSSGAYYVWEEQVRPHIDHSHPPRQMTVDSVFSSHTND